MRNPQWVNICSSQAPLSSLSIYTATSLIFLSLLPRSLSTFFTLFLSSQNSQWPKVKLQSNFEYCTTSKVSNTGYFRNFHSVSGHIFNYKRLQRPLNYQCLQHLHLCIPDVIFSKDFFLDTSVTSWRKSVTLYTDIAGLFSASAKC